MKKNQLLLASSLILLASCTCPCRTANTDLSKTKATVPITPTAQAPIVSPISVIKAPEAPTVQITTKPITTTEINETNIAKKVIKKPKKQRRNFITQKINNIRNNNGFLRRTREGTDDLPDRRDMQFMQNGRKVFKEVVPMVSAHILSHMDDEGVAPDNLKRMWLHQANKSMNDFVGRKVLGRVPEPSEQPNILQDYANTSSAGSIIAFSQNSAGLSKGDIGVICSFGAGYSVGSVIVERL